MTIGHALLEIALFSLFVYALKNRAPLAAWPLFIVACALIKL